MLMLTLAASMLAAADPPARLVLTAEHPITFELPAPPAGATARLSVVGLAFPAGDMSVRVYVNDPTAGRATGVTPRFVGSVSPGHEPAAVVNYAVNPNPALRRLAADKGHDPAAPLRFTLVLVPGRGGVPAGDQAATLRGLEMTAEPPNR